MNPRRAIAYRKQVSALLDAVLADEITPNDALNCWPTHANRDLSILCAYTMVWYFEADEERHQQEMFYADLQVKNMMDASALLKKGEPLPQALIKEYRRDTAPPEYSGSWTWRQPLWWFQNQMDFIHAILQTNPWLPVEKQTKKAPVNRGPFKF